MIAPEIQEICRQIGEVFFQKNLAKLGLPEGNFISKEDSHSLYEKTEREIRRINITDIQVIDGVIHISASHLGLLIGHKGQTIVELEKVLNKPIKIFEVQDCLLNHLIPFEPPDEDDFDVAMDRFYDSIPLPEDLPESMFDEDGFPRT